MKSLLTNNTIRIVLFYFLCFPFLTSAQHTFSIVAIDPTTGQIGSAGATCLDSIQLGGEEGALPISDIILGKGAIHTQSAWSPTNQEAARIRMQDHNETPQQVIDWLVANDPAPGNASSRQYNIVALDGTSAAFTGDTSFDQKGHRIGTNYAIAGNILISTEVLDDMENAFLNTTGDLATKLMAVMQAAKRPGADARCLSEGVSSRSAFIRVAQPSDTDSSYGNLWLDLNISYTPTGVDPIDELQTAFDAFFATLSQDTFAIEKNSLQVFPNPANHSLYISNASNQDYNRIEVYTLSGKKVLQQSVASPQKTLRIEVSSLQDEMYILKLVNDVETIAVKQVLIRHQN